MQMSAAVLHPIATARFCYALNCHMHHVIILTQCSAPHSRHGCRGRPLITSKYMNFDLYVKIGIQIQLIYLGGGSYIHFSKNSQL
jgi:hypothetical protein